MKINNKLIVQCFNIISKYKFTLLCVIYFFIICCVLSEYFFIYQYILFISGILSILLVMNILSKTKYTFIISCVLILLVSFDAYFAYTYQSPVFLGGMASIFETNSTEAIEMLKQAFIPAVSILVLSGFLILKSEQELKEFNLSRKSSLLILLFYWCFVLPIVFFLIVKNSNRLKQEFDSNNLLTIQRISLIATPFIYNDLLTFIAYQQEMYSFRSYGKTNRVLKKRVYLDSETETPEKIFLVIGESSWRERYSLYGYSNSTTPFLDSLSKTNVDFKYYKGISPAPITREALRMVLSFSTPFDKKPFFEEKNIVEMANDAGYETVWISNQNKIGMYDSYIGFVSSSAKINFFTEPKYDINDKKEDLDLIQVIKQKYIPNKKQFFIIHLIGSHFQYKQRYDEVDKKAISEGANTTELDYDRSIHHTDRVLREIYKVADKNQSSLLMYFSDHGEEIGEGHGFIGRGTPQFEIPYLIINNQKGVTIDSVVTKYINKKTNVLNSLSSIYILAQILGYHIPDDYIKQEVKDGEYIYHVDSKVYKYSDIEKENSKLK